jgi:hypothetical protein
MIMSSARSLGAIASGYSRGGGGTFNVFCASVFTIEM